MLGQNVYRLRTNAGLTQAELAERVGVWQTFIGQIELGKKLPSLRVLIRIADALGVTTEALLRGDIAASPASNGVAVRSTVGEKNSAV